MEVEDEVYEMHARVSKFGGAGGAGASRPSAEDVLPTLRSMDGFRGLISLVDQAGGDAMTITLWESEDATVPRSPRHPTVKDVTRRWDAR